MRVYIHTNHTSGLSARLGYELVTGWWPTDREKLARKRVLEIWHHKWAARAQPAWMIEHSAKWQWAAEKAHNLEPSSSLCGI